MGNASQFVVFPYMVYAMTFYANQKLDLLLLEFIFLLKRKFTKSSLSFEIVVLELIRNKCFYECNEKFVLNFYYFRLRLSIFLNNSINQSSSFA